MDRPIDTCLFSPREATSERYAASRTHRRPRQKPNKPSTARRIGNHYTACSYGRAIQRACDQAFPPPDDLSVEQIKQWRKEHSWHPHQLRHALGTDIRREFGVEASQAVLGHAKVNTTELYAQIDECKAVQIALKIG
ncbi:MAG: tyrosine-type recombinase/integrase [Planctomycetes bacterium]|nr:tyrosine-type recombinase/integrase [Planctomycetota bacterium]